MAGIRLARATAGQRPGCADLTGHPRIRGDLAFEVFNRVFRGVPAKVDGQMTPSVPLFWSPNESRVSSRHCGLLKCARR